MLAIFPEIFQPELNRIRLCVDGDLVDESFASEHQRRPERVALVVPAAAPHRRISLTLRALFDARAVMILIQGEAKRAAIEQAAGGDPAQYPIAAFLQQETVPVHVYYSP